MKLAASIRKSIARLIASNRYTRVFFKRIALDERLFLLLLKDPRCKKRVSENSELQHQLSQLVDLKPIASSRPTPKIKEQTLQIIESITDVSLGINWGPAAFPLTRHAVYFKAGMGKLAESWLRRLPSDAFVVLLVHSREIDAARLLAGNYRQVKSVIELPLEPEEDRYGEGLKKQLGVYRGLDAVVVPLSGKCRSMAGVPGNYLSDLKPEFASFRFLWLLGFRQFGLLTFHGFRQIEIPYFPDDFINKHKGKRCFVIGNGPGLERLDLSRLSGEVTFGSNRCVPSLRNQNTKLTYCVCSDHLFIEEHLLGVTNPYAEDTVKFVPLEYVPLLSTANCCPVSVDDTFRMNAPFSPDPGVLHTGFGDAYILLQLAVFMGCSPIYILEMDILQQMRLQETARTDAEQQYQIPAIEEATRVAYENARLWMEERNIVVRNATADTVSLIFDRIAYDTLF